MNSEKKNINLVTGTLTYDGYSVLAQIQAIYHTDIIILYLSLFFADHDSLILLNPTLADSLISGIHQIT